MDKSRNGNLRSCAIALAVMTANPGGIAMQADAFAGDGDKNHDHRAHLYRTGQPVSFEDVQIPLKSTGKIGFISELTKATGIVFRETGGDYNYEFHTAPRRQYVVNLEGEVEIEVGDGTRRILRSGDILLAEDTTGQGHISRAVAGKPRKSLFITLD